MLDYSINRDITEIVLIVSFILTSISVIYMVITYNRTYRVEKITELNENTHEYDDEYHEEYDKHKLLNKPIKRNTMFLMVAIIPLITTFVSYQVYKSNYGDNTTTDLQNLTFTVEDKRVSHYSNKGIVYEIEPKEDMGRFKIYYTVSEKDDIILELKEGDGFVLLEKERIDGNINSDKKIMLNDLDNYRWDIQDEYIK